jgi:hypothetical protein
MEACEITLLVWLIGNSILEPPLEVPQRDASEIGCELENKSFQLIDEKGGERTFAAVCSEVRTAGQSVNSLRLRQ